MKRALLLFLLVVALLAGAVWAFVSLSHLLPRTDLPEFDARKAAQLSSAQRRAYEQELFSELQLWNQGSKKYPRPEDIARREQRWLAMADDGFELAHVVLRVLQPTGARVYALSSPLKRLDALAKSGDMGAMCLIAGLVNVAAVAHNPERHLDLTRRWLVKGAELGHPQCLTELGRRLLFGVHGFEKDAVRGLDLEFAARSAGYVHDAGVLVLHFRAKGLSNLEDVRRRYCWAVIEEITWLSDSSGLVIWDLGQVANRTGRTDIAQLAAALKASRYALQDCINLGKGS